MSITTKVPKVIWKQDASQGANFSVREIILGDSRWSGTLQTDHATLVGIAHPLIRKESVPKIMLNNTLNLFLTAISVFVISNHNSFRALSDKIASVYFIWKKYIYILALGMASSGNQHCANCIGALSFPMTLWVSGTCPQSAPSPEVESVPNLKHGSLVARVYIPNGVSIGSAVLHSDARSCPT